MNSGSVLVNVSLEFKKKTFWLCVPKQKIPDLLAFHQSGGISYTYQETSITGTSCHDNNLNLRKQFKKQRYELTPVHTQNTNLRDAMKKNMFCYIN